MVHLNLFHTAQVHCATFDALRDRIAPDVRLIHHVQPGWLASAQNGISPDLAIEISKAVTEAGEPAICTCTTIGPVAEAAGAIRIDEPMMQVAAQTTGSVLMAYCLESTRGPSLTLLQSALDAAGNTSLVHSLPMTKLWPLFEAGKTGQFASGIAKAVREALRDIADPGCVVLAQASMAGAALLLADEPCPVLASPELALRAGLALL